MRRRMLNGAAMMLTLCMTGGVRRKETARGAAHSPAATTPPVRTRHHRPPPRLPNRWLSRRSCRQNRCVTRAIASASLDDINRDSPLKPVFFELDSSEITPDGQAVLDANAAVLKQHADLGHHH